MSLFMIRNHGVDTSTISSREVAIKQFESAWQQGNRPNITDYLDSTPGNRRTLLVELVHIDLEFRYRNNETPQVEQYLNDFPELKENSEDVIEFIRTEFYLRHRHGHAVSETDYFNRFPQHRDLLLSQLSTLDSTLSWPRRLSVLPPRDRPQIPGFEIEEELGHGGMGVVYRASQPSLHRVVAIKTLIHGVAATTNLKERFRHEAEAIARLDHPHIVPIYEVGEWTPNGATSSIPYFVMKYYSGGSLANATMGPGTRLEQHTRVMETIAQAVHHAHQRGILHRDLKPSNILLDEQGEPHVVDFGLAGRFNPDDPQSMTATVMGTPAYMAPEQARSPSQITTAADVYGLGAIFYQLLTGQPPFRGETPLAVLELVTSREPVRPSTHNAKITKGLETICLKCLEKDPLQRYESAAAFASDLERHRTGRSIIARPSPTWERAWRTMRRHPVITFLMLLTFGVIVAALAILTHSNIRIRQQEQDTRDALVRETWMRKELFGTLDREQQLLYGKRIFSVGRLWAANQVQQAWDELDLCPERFRGWEWRYFNGLRSNPPTTISTPDSVVRGIGFISESQIITGDSKGMVTIWDWKTKSPRATWQGSQKAVRNLAVYPQKKWLAVCDQDDVSVWDYEKQVRLAYLPGSMWVVFSPDGNYLASAHTTSTNNSKDVIIWDTVGWQQKWLLKGHSSGILHGAITPDSKILATTSSDRTVRRWSLVDGTQIGEPWKRPLPTFCLAYLPDGQVLAEAQPTSVTWNNAMTGKELGHYNWSNASQLVVLTGRVQVSTGTQQSLVAHSGPSHDIQVWDISRNRSVVMLRGHSMHIAALRFSPDGKHLATVSNDQTIRIWDFDQPIEFQSRGSITQFPAEMVVSPDGELVAVVPNFHSQLAGKDQVRILKIADGSEVGHYSGVGTAAFTKDGCLLTAPGEGGVACWNLKTQERVWHYDAPSQRCAYVGVSADGKTIVAVQHNGQIKLLDRDTGKPLHELPALERFLGTASFSKQANRLAFVGQHQVEIWDLSSRSMVGQFPMNGTRKMAFTQDGGLLATAEADRVIRLRDGKTGALLMTFPGHPRSINTLAFNSDGKRLVSSCADGLIRIWDVATGLELTVLPGQFEESVLVTWDHLKDQIIAVDTKVHVWHATRESPGKK